MLRITITDVGPGADVAVKGALVDQTASRLKRALEDVRRGMPLLVVLDLRQVTVIDGVGIRTMLEAEADAREKHWDLAVVSPQMEPARSVFRDPEMKSLICGVTPEAAEDLLHIYAKGFRPSGSVRPQWSGH